MTFCASVCVRLCVWLYCKMSASSLSLHRIYPFQNPSNAAIPFKAVSGVAELLLEVELLLVLEI